MLWKFNCRIWLCLRVRVNFFRKRGLSSASPIDWTKSPQTYTLKEPLPPIPFMLGVPWTSESPCKGLHLCLTSQKGKYEHLQFRGWSKGLFVECEHARVLMYTFDAHSPFTMWKGTEDGGRKEQHLWPLPWNHDFIPQYSYVELQRIWEV